MIFNKYREQILYLFFGVLTTIVNYICYIFCRDILTLQITAANLISWVVSVTFAFVVNKIYVFKSVDSPITGEIISFYLSRVGSLLIEIILMEFCVYYIRNVSDKIIKILINIIVIILNYIASKIIFKNKPAD